MADHQSTAGATREYDVSLRLCLVEPLSDHALATLAESILEAVETYAASRVDGAAIGYTRQPMEIHLDFMTEAESLADVDIVVKRVNDIIVGETSIEFKLSTHREAVSA